MAKTIKKDSSHGEQAKQTGDSKATGDAEKKSWKIKRQHKLLLVAC